jgi:hypothetical protein
MTRTLPFRANGHLTRIADGELTEIFTPDPGLTELARKYGIETIVPSLGHSRCGNCDALLLLTITDDAILVRGDPCPYPEGLTSVIALDVPSGKIIVTDDLRPVYNWNDTDMASYNSALGQHQAIQAMAATGCAYGPVGNSCPGLFRTGGDSYVIASPGYDEDTDTELLPGHWELLAGIVTDLWAYSVADYDHWIAKGGDPDSLSWSRIVVGIPPGRYEFTHHSGENSFNRDAWASPVIFAHIERIT